MAFFNPFAKSCQNQNLQTAFDNNEKEKKRTYNQCVIQVEHGSFTPLVFSAYGGYGREAHQFIKKLVESIAEKKDFETSAVMNYIQMKISFALMRSLVNCVRGTRSRFQHQVIINADNTHNEIYKIRD